MWDSWFFCLIKLVELGFILYEVENILNDTLF